jgi:hypothetical protein
MTQQRIHIENVKIRIPHSRAGQARSIAGGLGRDIAHAVAASFAGNGGNKNINEITAGKICVNESADAHGLHEQITGRLTRELRKKFDSESGDRWQAL